MQLTPQDDRLLEDAGAVLDRQNLTRIGVAVSGGSDSCALLHLAAIWAKKAGVILEAVTVDHGLRTAAVAEAKAVAEICAGLGVEHTTLKWTGWDGRGNLQDQARQARYGLMADWAKDRGIGTIALGHTADDQAETFLLRLARGSGVDGLSGMAQSRHENGIDWLRPVLFLERQKLRDFLCRHAIKWFDDPSNEDEKYDRVKARKILKLLEPLGIDKSRLAATAQALQPARRALEWQTGQAAQSVATVRQATVVFDAAKFIALQPEIGTRLLQHALRWVSSAPYPPRRSSLENLQTAIFAQKSSTLHGCRIIAKKNEIRIGREYQAVKDMVCPTDQIWDQRWKFSGPATQGYEIRALGEAGLQQCPDWRSMNMKRACLLATPAVWQKQTLVAAPIAGFGNGWRSSALFGPDHFISSIISH